MLTAVKSSFFMLAHREHTIVQELARLFIQRDKWITMMLQNVQQFISSKELLWAWTSRTIRGRYQQSMLGWLWALIQPVATVAIFTLIFTRFVPVDTGDTPYILFSYVAVVPWTLLATSLTDMTQSLVQNMNLVTKIYFPREVLPVAAMLARLMDFGVAITLYILLILFYQVPISPIVLLYLPIILVTQLALIMGLGLAFAAMNVFYRDVQPLLTLGIQIWFYASPIIYPVSLVPEQLRPIYYLNPMTGLLEGYRSVLLYQQAPGPSLLVAAGVASLIFVAGYWFFKRVEFQFADIV
jgi:lipopolysaccharide transport system permease protein